MGLNPGWQIGERDRSFQIRNPDDELFFRIALTGSQNMTSYIVRSLFPEKDSAVFRHTIIQLKRPLMKKLLSLLAIAGTISGAAYAATISGNVSYQTSGNPIAGQAVYITDTGHIWSTTVYTDAAGNYTATIPSTVPTTSPGNQLRVESFGCGVSYKYAALNTGSAVTNFVLCSGSSPLPRYIYGNVSLSGAANTDTSIVYVIRKAYNASVADTTLTVIDSIYTDITGYYSKTYTTAPGGTLLLKAALLHGHPQYANFLPTYHSSSLNWSGATPLGILNIIGSAATNINMIAGTNPGGPAFVGGSVLLGANKTSAVGDPLSKRMLILTKSTGEPIAFTYSDASGKFQFPSLPYGSYKIFGDALGKTNPALSLTVSATTPRISNIVFEENSKTFAGKFNNVGVLTPALEALSVFPNPATASVQVRGLESISGSKTLTLSTATGALISRQVVETGNPVITTDNLPAGVYMLQVQTTQGNVSLRLVK
jgi:hypothetical protein